MELLLRLAESFILTRFVFVLNTSSSLSNVLARTLLSSGADCVEDRGLCETKFSTLDPEVDLILVAAISRWEPARPRARPLDEVYFAPVLILLLREAGKKERKKNDE